MTEVRAENLSKSFGDTHVTKNLNFTIKQQEFLTLLGASGCGKTTTLRLVLGSIFPDSGRIYFNGEDVTDIPCYKRNVGIVYQDYALFPHLNVYENIAFGLKVKKEKNTESKVKEIMETLQISGLEERYPHQISGGQQQRVALARTLVVRPKILLLDEPLSNVDAKLRYELRNELKKIQRMMKIATLYVTHDQEEALTISDRIAIMNNGRIIEVGKPRDIYFHSKENYTKEFMGVISKRLKNLEQIGIR